MVVAVADDEVERHQAEHLPQLLDGMRELAASPEQMTVIGGGQMIVDVHQGGETDNVQFAAVIGTVEAL